MDPMDPRNLGSYFSRHGRALVLYASQWLHRDTAEDVVQQVFLRLCSSTSRVANVKSWLFRSVRNAAIDRLRSQRRWSRHEAEIGCRAATWFQSDPDAALDAQALQQALASLVAEQREIIILRIWSGLTLAEAAEVTGEAVSTLFSRYRAGLTALRERMEKPCGKTNATSAAGCGNSNGSWRR